MEAATFAALTATVPEFIEFPKMARFAREIIVTEKIDGTNAQVWISDDGTDIRAGSRNRWLTYSEDNFGFAKWVMDHRDELLTLGPGRHFGEWWGSGIQRRYGLDEKRFSLFNVSRWGGAARPAAMSCRCSIAARSISEPSTTALRSWRAKGRRRARVHEARGRRDLPHRRERRLQAHHREGRSAQIAGRRMSSLPDAELGPGSTPTLPLNLTGNNGLNT
jgi:hypothetical protein